MHNTTSPFEFLRFVLVETSHPGNVGAAARAIKTMGFGQLVLVSPRFEDVLNHPDALAFASGADDVLKGAKIVSTISEAVEGCQFVASVSARLREFSPPVIDAREFANRILDFPSQHLALVFGSERYGLPNQIVMDSNVLVNIPTNSAYSSLNLAQAIQILAYEARMAFLTLSSVEVQEKRELRVGYQGQLASSEQVEAMFVHLEQALMQIDFLDANNPKKLMPRLKRMFARAQLETEEVNIMRGISRKILNMKN